ncbi:MAG: hypothetical protein C4525_07940 [Desulfarculus sp.]|nr:MAG: hypothetical protein C4525_07940 [Desulfarculus sp.]
MKKVLLVLLGMLLTVVAAVAALYLSLDLIAQKGITHFGSRIMQTPVQVEMVKVEVFPAQVLLRGLEIGDPYGNPGPYAALVASLRLRVKLESLIEPKIVIEDLVISGPAFILGPSGQDRSAEALKSGLERIAGRLAAGVQRLPPGLRLQIDRLLVDRARLIVRQGPSGQKRSLDLARLQMKDLGKAGAGLTPAQVVELLRRYLESQVQATAGR